MISSGDVEWMQATQELVLPDSLVIQSRTTTFTSDGGDEVWADADAVPCRVSPIQQSSGDEEVLSDKVTERPSYQLTFPVSVSLSAEERVKVNGTVYEVESVEDAREFQTAGRAIIRRLT